MSAREWIRDATWRILDVMPSQARAWISPALSCSKDLAVGVPLSILRGFARGTGKFHTVVVAGSEPWASYLAQRFFATPPQREWVGKVRLSTLPHALQRLSVSANLVITRADELTARLLLTGGCLAVPEWVDLLMTVPDDFETLTRGNHSLKSDLKTAQRNGLICQVSHSAGDLDTFYHVFYVPFVRKRHGAYAYTWSLGMLRYYLRRGVLFWVMQEGQRIAGAVLRARGTVVQTVAMGTINGDYAPVRLGATTAIYCHAIEYARASGCTAINFGGSRPILTDGALRFKTKWGMRLVEQSRPCYDFLIRWEKLDDSILAFLSQTPLVFRDRGQLSAVAYVPGDGPLAQQQAAGAYRALWAPGLHRLYLMSGMGWQPGSTPSPDTHLVDARSALTGGARAFLTGSPK